MINAYTNHHRVFEKFVSDDDLIISSDKYKTFNPFPYCSSDIHLDTKLLHALYKTIFNFSLQPKK